MSKKCNICKLEKELSEFYTDNTRKDKHTIKCKKCSLENYKTYALKNSNKIKFRRLFSSLGITELTYKELLVRQNNKCAICNKPETSKYKNGNIRDLSVDHCHRTGVIRGLLCNHCNSALGLLKDNIQNFQNAITYLTKTL
jgi:hypothetical protein